MNIIKILFLLQIMFSCSVNTKFKNTNEDCAHLSFIKNDSLFNDKSNEILKLIEDSTFKVIEEKNEYIGLTSSLYFNNNELDIWHGTFKGNFIRWKNLIFFNNSPYIFLNTTNKNAFKISYVQESIHTINKTLHCYKNMLIYHTHEVYDTYFTRDFYLIMDKDLNTVRAFAVPSLRETVPSPIQGFRFTSKNTLAENKEGELVINMQITIIKDEKDKQNFSVNIPFDEAEGTFKSLQKILPLISPDIPISDTDNITIKKLPNNKSKDR